MVQIHLKAASIQTVINKLWIRLPVKKEGEQKNLA